MTIERKKKKCKDCGEQKFIFSRGRCKFCAKIYSLNNKSKKHSHSTSEKREEAMRLFAKKRKLEESDDSGYCRCVTCGAKAHHSVIHNGHYIDRKHNSTTFLSRNNHPQCENCNVFLRGNIPKYEDYLESRYGVGTVEELKRLKSRVFKLTQTYLDELITKLKKEIDVLEAEKQDKNTI